MIKNQGELTSELVRTLLSRLLQGIDHSLQPPNLQRQGGYLLVAFLQRGFNFDHLNGQSRTHALRLLFCLEGGGMLSIYVLPPL